MDENTNQALTRWAVLLTQACCACRRVRYDPERTADGLCRDRWVCETCGCEFARREADRAEVARLRAEAARLRGEVDRMADDYQVEAGRAAEAEARAEKLEAEVEDEIQRRDRYCDAITDAHVALGGDGTWRAYVGGGPQPPNSGHLHLDVPVMARELSAQRDELRERLEAAADLLGEVLKAEREQQRCDAAGRRICRWCGDLADHPRYETLCTMVRIREFLEADDGEDAGAALDEENQG